MTDLYNKLATLTPQTIGAMHQALMPSLPVPNKKSLACKALAEYARSSGINTLADLQALAGLKMAAAPAAPAPADQARITVLDSQIHSLAKDLAHDRQILSTMRKDIVAIHSDTAAVATGLSDLQNKVGAVTGAATAQAALIGDLVKKITQVQTDLAAAPTVDIDQAQVQAAVIQAVDQAFGAFKSIVRPEQNAQVADYAAALAQAQTVLAEDAFNCAVLDAKGAGMTVTHWHRADAPAIDPCHIWTPEILRHLVLAEQSGSTLANVWLGGEKGAGKSMTAQQYAARTGRAFTRINFEKLTTVESFIGAIGLNGGSTEFVPGAFLQAYSTPGSVILLDEVTNPDPGVMNILNGFLEPGAAVNFGGKVWSKAPGVMILAADNTLGNGDQTGRYAGTRAQGAALLNRFGQVVHMTFLPRNVERDAVIKRTGCSAALADHVLDAVSVARAKVQSGEIIDAPSIRNVMAFIEALRILPVRAAWDATIAAVQPAESAVALQQVFESCINETTIRNAI